MRRLLAALLIFVGTLVFVAGLAQAQLTQTGAGKKAGGGGGAATWTATSGACVDNAFASATVTFAGAAIGTGEVVVGTYNDASRTVTSVTANGNAGTVVGTGNAQAAMYRATNTGTTGNIVIVFSAAPGIACYTAGFLTGVNTTPTATVALATGFRGEPISLGASLTVPASGVGVVLATSFTVTATPLPLTWANATRDAASEGSITVSNGGVIGTGNMTATGTPTFACANAGCNFQQTAMMAGAWGP